MSRLSTWYGSSSSATGRVVRYVRAELSAKGRAVHGPSCPRAEFSGNLLKYMYFLLLLMFVYLFLIFITSPFG